MTTSRHSLKKNHIDDYIKTLIEKEPYRIVRFLHEDKTSDTFKLVIGEDNQVENLKKVLSFKQFKELYSSPFEFKLKFSVIQTSERISFIKDFVGIDNLLTLSYPLLTLTEILSDLPPSIRFSFLINDLGINNFKKIMYGGSDSYGFTHEKICKLLPQEDFISLCNILFTEEQQIAKSKLEAYRDAIEDTDFITYAGKWNDSLHGCIEIEIRNGKKKFVSDTAAYILNRVRQYYYILSDHVSTLAKVQDACKRAIEYNKINPQLKEGMIGTTLKFAIWMTRTNEAMDLYTRIAEDKIPGNHLLPASEFKAPKRS
ncbi:MAG: hypothetical protein JO149_08900 [Gammaproteobacteria bacterium]|nr:hypothetical protein [Gammaproteobacteria bacterium]